MHKTVISLLILTSCAFTPQGLRKPSSLFPGTRVDRLEPRAFPQHAAMVRMLQGGQHWCSGALLDVPGGQRRIVLTASHCVHGYRERYPVTPHFQVSFPVLEAAGNYWPRIDVVGTWDGILPPTWGAGASAIWSYPAIPNDLALLLLAEPAPEGVTALPLAESSGALLANPPARLETLGAPRLNCQGWPEYTPVAGSDCALLGHHVWREGAGRALTSSCFFNVFSSGGPLIATHRDRSAIVGVVSTQTLGVGTDYCAPQDGDEAARNFFADVTDDSRFRVAGRLRSAREVLHEQARLLLAQEPRRGPAHAGPREAKVYFPDTKSEFPDLDFSSPHSATVQIQLSGQPHCSATLLDAPGAGRRVLLTASHCVPGLPALSWPETRLTATVPALQAADVPFRVVGVANGLVAPQSAFPNPEDVPNDVALLLLDRAVPEGPMALPLAGNAAHVLRRTPEAVQTLGSPMNNCEERLAASPTVGLDCELTGHTRAQTPARGRALSGTCFVNAGSSGGTLLALEGDRPVILGVIAGHVFRREESPCEQLPEGNFRRNYFADVTRSSVFSVEGRNRTAYELIHAKVVQLVEGQPAQVPTRNSR